MIPVVLTPRPLAEPDTLLQPAGRTVRAMLVDAVAQGRIEAKYLGQAELHIDGAVIPRDQALDHVLEEGQIVNLVVYPHGGGGGGGKDVGQILLQVAVIAVSMWVGGGAGGAISSTFWARVAAAAVMVAGNMAISAIYAPKPAPAEKANDRYALQSASNRYRQWGMAPLMLGTCVVAPDLAVKTFTRAIGDDVWIYGILAHHYGPCQIDELKIGDTLVSSMGASDVKFVHHLTPGPRTFTLVPNDIDQLDLAPEELTATPTTATPVVRASASEGETFELDFYLPGGLYFQKDDGRKIAASVTVTVRYRQVDQFGDPVGSGAWTNGLTIPLTGSSKDPLRITRSLNLPMGRYEFECRRSVLEDTNEKRHTDVAWSAIRAIAYRKPVTDEVLSISEFAIRATALNQGNLAPITCKITPLCQTWTGTEWGPPVPTSNPAALTRWLLTGPAPAKPLLSPQADQGLRAWSALCDEYGWEAHVPIQEDRTQAEALALLERAGRAGVFWDGTQAVASPWVEKPAPKQMFTGVNLKDHRFEIAYADPVHAFRVEFQNLEQRGEADEIMVYNDGYAETAGVDDNGDPVAAATLIEALRLEDGQKTPERAYRDARWEFGRRKHQRRFDTWSADVEAVVCRYGDRVRLAWSRAGGEGGARVRARRWSAGEGSNVTGLRLDREVEMSPGVDYVVDLRLVDQLLTGVPVVNPAVDGPVQTREIVFVDVRSPELSPRRGDMIAFGPVEQVTEDVEILGLEPGEGLTANLTGVRYVAPLLMAGETGPIPELQTRLSLDRLKDPPRPTLLGVQVSADGVRAGFSLPPWKGSPVTAFTVRWRIKPEVGEQSSWLPLPDLPGDAMTLTTPPLRELPGEDEATRVEIEIRAVTAAGQTSPALAFTAVLPVVATPVEAVWSVTPRGTAEDGTSQPVLVVSGTVTDPAVGRVAIAYGLTETGPWNGSYEGPAGTVSHEIKGLVSSVDYWVLITYASPQGVAGGSLVIGPRTTSALTAGVGAGDPIWEDLYQSAKDLLKGAIEDAQALLEEERKREIGVADVLDRLGLGLLLDPVERTALIKSETLVEGVGPTGLPETLVQMRTRLVAADAANAASAAQALIDAKVYTDGLRNDAAIAYATYTAMGTAISASAASVQSWTTAQIAGAVANLVTASQMATSLATAKGQWESYATAAAANAVIGLDTVAAREAALATARGQWESYASAAAASAVVGLDTVALREAAIAATVLQLRSETTDAITTATATLATQTSLNGVSAIAALALSTANGNEAYAALSVEANGWLTALRVNGVSREIGVVAEVFSLRSSSSGIRSEYRGGVWYIYDPDAGVRTMYGKSFGGSAKLQWWTGPASIAEGSETKANAFVYIAMTAPRFGGSDVVASGGLGYTAGSMSVARGTSPTTIATLTSSTSTSLVEVSSTAASDGPESEAPVVTTYLYGVSGGVETLLASKAMTPGGVGDPITYVFPPVQAAYPTFRVKVRGTGPSSATGIANVDVTLKITPLATA